MPKVINSKIGGRKATIVKPFTTVNRGAVPYISTAPAPSVTEALAQPAPAMAQGQSQQQAAQFVQGAVVGAPVGINAAGLRPIARLEIMSNTRTITLNGTIGQCAATVVCDPTGVATNSLPVQSWSTRFAGFQQYRVRSTKWILTPIRPLVGTATSSQGPGHVAVWVQDSPQAGSPTTTEFLQANRKNVVVNSDHIDVLTYTTNEPQDLNLTDIFLPPSHITGSSISTGQHAYMVYGDNSLTGLLGYATSGFIALFTITAVYDIEFFGVGGI